MTKLITTAVSVAASLAILSVSAIAVRSNSNNNPTLNVTSTAEAVEETTLNTFSEIKIRENTFEPETESETVSEKNNNENKAETNAEKEVKADFSRLKEVFPDNCFNCKNRNACSEALYCLLWDLGSAEQYFKNGEIQTLFYGDAGFNADINNKLCGEGYKKVPAAKIDNILRVVYNTEPTHMAEYEKNGYKFCIYDGTYYYSAINIIGLEGGLNIVDSKKNSTGVYTVSIIRGQESDPIGSYTVKAKPVMVNGKSDWSFYSIEESNESKADCAVENNHNTPAWEEAYQNYLLKHLNENGNHSDESFSLAYIDEDNIPELVVAESNMHGSKTHILIYSDGQVKDCGEYGFCGEIGYYEKTGIITENYAGCGNIFGGWYKKTGNQIVKKDEFSETITYDEATDSCSYSYTINGVSVSEEEFENLQQSYEKYGTLKTAGSEYALTESNIYSYCK